MTTLLMTEEMNNLVHLAQREPVHLQHQGEDVAVVLSAQDFARMRRDNIDDFIALCDAIGQRAEAAGLTEEKLAEILSDPS